MIQQPDLHSHLLAAFHWIRCSRSPRSGGARAFYTPLRGWTKTYPQATGCLIPTVLRIGATLGEESAQRLAERFGEYLLDIQHPSGGWHGGTWPASSDATLSPFSSAQIVKGLCALYAGTSDARWLSAAVRASTWIAGAIADDGPSYNTQIAWPLLEVWSLTGSSELRDCAVRILDRALQQRTILGAFRGWGFHGSDAAFTHTIGFTLRGFLESSRLLDDWPRYGKPLLAALRRLADDALASRGRLPGAYNTDWRSDGSYTCLVGNVQIALCLLAAQRFAPNRTFPKAAGALIDEVCRRQHRNHPIGGLRGAIPGSYPIWGRYLRGSYPIWGAKYFCDAIIALGAPDQATVFRVADSRGVRPNVAFTPM